MFSAMEVKAGPPRKPEATVPRPLPSSEEERYLLQSSPERLVTVIRWPICSTTSTNAMGAITSRAFTLNVGSVTSGRPIQAASLIAVKSTIPRGMRGHDITYHDADEHGHHLFKEAATQEDAATAARNVMNPTMQPIVSKVSEAPPSNIPS